MHAKLAVVRTSSSLEVWRTVLNRLLEDDAECAALRVRWRPSRQGGRPWVAPSATPQQLAAHRCACGRPAAAQTLEYSAAQVVVSGSLGHDPSALLAELMRVVGGRTGLALREATAGEGFQLGVWRRLAAADPSVEPGRLRLYLVGPSQELPSNFRQGWRARRPAPAFP